MTDGKMLKIMAQLDRLACRAIVLMDSLENHPNGDALIEDLKENGCGYLWDFPEIARPHLVHPERWEFTKHGDPKWMGAMDNYRCKQEEPGE